MKSVCSLGLIFFLCCSDSQGVDISLYTTAVQQLSTLFSQEERAVFFVSHIVPRAVFSYRDMDSQAPSSDAVVILDLIQRRYAFERDLAALLGVIPSSDLLKFVNERHFGTI